MRWHFTYHLSYLILDTEDGEELISTKLHRFKPWDCNTEIVHYFLKHTSDIIKAFTEVTNM